MFFRGKAYALLAPVGHTVDHRNIQTRTIIGASWASTKRMQITGLFKLG